MIQVFPSLAENGVSQRRPRHWRSFRGIGGIRRIVDPVDGRTDDLFLSRTGTADVVAATAKRVIRFEAMTSDGGCARPGLQPTRW